MPRRRVMLQLRISIWTVQNRFPAAAPSGPRCGSMSPRPPGRCRRHCGQRGARGWLCGTAQSSQGHGCPIAKFLKRGRCLLSSPAPLLRNFSRPLAAGWSCDGVGGGGGECVEVAHEKGPLEKDDGEPSSRTRTAHGRPDRRFRVGQSNGQTGAIARIELIGGPYDGSAEWCC